MTQNTDRDPYSEGQMAAAVAIYLNAVHPLSTIDRDEADIEFEAALLEQGVIAPHEAIESIEADSHGATVVIEAYMFERVIVHVTTEGAVRVVA